MFDQSTLNWLFGLLNLLLGFILNQLWQSLKDLQKDDKLLVDRVAAIEVLVAGQYVRKDDFDRTSDALFKKLDKIYDKLDEKVDKKGDK